MGSCFSINEIKREKCINGHGNPTTFEEIKELYKYESSMCKIIYQIIKNGKVVSQSGSGFFCEINDNNIPFKKALFTNNHILDENIIKNNKGIEFEYLKNNIKIKITKDRLAFTNKELDYTCIEIFDSDKIKNFFKIDDEIFENRNNIKNNEIYVLQYPMGGNLAYDMGKIIDIEDDKILHSVSTLEGSSGSPLIKRYNINLVLGMHLGGDEDKKYNYAIPFDIIIKDIKNKMSMINYKSTEYRNKINLIYHKKVVHNCSLFNPCNPNRIFGEEFVENNKNNILLVINGKQSKLIEEYNLKEGVKTNVQIIIINKLTNLEEMFSGCCSLENLEELKYLNTKEVTNFSRMFSFCSLLSDIKPLQNWDVSNGYNFDYMFHICTSLSDINPLQNWNVSNVNSFTGMFHSCPSLSDIKPL